MIEAHDGGVDIGDHVEAARHVGRARHLGDVQAHEGDVEHVGGPQRIPRIEHAILAPADADAVGLHLLDARSCRALGNVSWRPCSMMLISGLGIAETPASAITGKSFDT